MGARGPRAHPLKARILRALAAGELFVSEASWIAAVSRQRIEQWCAAAGIDHHAARKAYIRKLWTRELRRQRMKAKGMSPRRRTKSQLRQIADKAKTAWDHRTTPPRP